MADTGVIGLQRTSIRDTLCYTCFVIRVKRCPSGVREGRRNLVVSIQHVAVVETQLTACEGIQDIEAHHEFEFLTRNELCTDSSVTRDKVGFHYISYLVLRSGIERKRCIIAYVLRIVDMRTVETHHRTQVPFLCHTIFETESSYRVCRHDEHLFLQCDTTSGSVTSQRTGLRLNRQCGRKAYRVEGDTYRDIAYLRAFPFFLLLCHQYRRGGQHSENCH